MNIGVGIGVGSLQRTRITPGTIVVKDNFNRANSTVSMGISDTGQPWIPLSGTWGINSNQAYRSPIGIGQMATVVDSGLSDCSVEVTIPVMSLETRVVIRAVDSGNYLQLKANDISYTFRTTINNITTQIASYRINPADGDVIRFDMVGSTISFYINGVKGFDVTTSQFKSATKHGIGSYGNTTTERFDNFKVVSI